MIRLALILCLIASPVMADIRVVDGDTVHIDGEKIRIMGLNTPETWRPKCIAEEMLGKQATAYGKVLAEQIGRIERHGMDRYGRTLARVYLEGGGSWAEAMISRGLAVPFECPNGRCPIMTRWCSK